MDGFLLVGVIRFACGSWFHVSTVCLWAACVVGNTLGGGVMSQLCLTVHLLLISLKLRSVNAGSELELWLRAHVPSAPLWAPSTQHRLALEMFLGDLLGVYYIILLSLKL